MRSLIERISREKIIKRKLPKRFGAVNIYTSPDCALRYWSYNAASYDKTLFEACEELVRPGDVVWDIGANAGFFTYPAAFLAGTTGRVLALEPDIFCVDLLRKTNAALRDNRLFAPVSILPTAIASTVGVATLCVANRGRSANYLDNHSGVTYGSTQTGGIRDTQDTLTVTLDWLLDHYPAPNVLKIDVEGFEVEVLHGASKILTEIKPRILCEVSEESVQEVGLIFKNNHYQMYDAELPQEKRLSLDYPTWNTIALPEI